AGGGGSKPGAASSTIAATSPTVAATDAEAPASRASTSTSSGRKDALTIGQVAASASRTYARLGSLPPAACSPSSSAYSSASQYTSRVMTTAATTAPVDRRPPAVSRIAAVMIAP